MKNIYLKSKTNKIYLNNQYHLEITVIKIFFQENFIAIISNTDSHTFKHIFYYILKAHVIQ